MDIQNLVCTVFEERDEALEQYVERRLEGYNERQSPWVLQKRMPGRGPRPLSVYLRNSDGDTFGGVIGYTLWDWLHIEYLWVWEELRGQGWGSALIRSLEDAARQRGCRHAQVYTWSFQAPDFYGKLGYRIVGRLDDYPPGHTDYWLRKDFETAE